MKFGSSSTSMNLELKDSKDNFICKMSDDLQQLGYYTPQEGHTIHVSLTTIFKSIYFNKRYKNKT